MGSADNPSEMVVQQRVRNQIIAYFQMASSFEYQLEYQRKVPIEYVPDEVINSWEDNVTSETLDYFREPVFTQQEQAAIRTFHATWDTVANELPERLPPLTELFKTEPWNRLRAAASVCLAVFMVRDTFDDFTEESFEKRQ